MFGIGKKKDTQPKEKYRFEKPYHDHQSDWRKPQGVYINDIHAKKQLSMWLSRFLISSQLLSLFLMVVIFIGMSYMLIFSNYENVIMDDGSRLFCTILEDDSIGIAY